MKKGKERGVMNLLKSLNYKIFTPVAIFIVAFVIYGIAAPSSFASFTTTVKDWAGTHFAWLAYFIIVACVFACIYMCISKFGKTKIGGEDAKPEYKTFTWLAMIICGNIGIAMMFYAVVEPASFFSSTPVFWNLESETTAAANMAVAQATFHWGGFNWVANMVIGFTSVYLFTNHGMPFRPSTGLYPVLKEKTFGPLGTVYDVICLIAIMGAIITGFGFGVMQFSTGLAYNTGLEVNNLMYIIVVAITLLILCFSSARGFQKGLAVLSNINVAGYIILLVVLFCFGPTLKLCELALGSMGALLDNFLPMAFNGDFMGDGDGWNVNNTGFTWFWTLVYSPFCGMYLAKISRGRTIRQFIAASTVVPTCFLFLWFCFWGGDAMNMMSFMNINVMDVIGDWGAPVANFVVLKYLPLKWLTIPMILFCVMIGFVTLVDAESNFIAGMCQKKIKRNGEAPVALRLFFCAILGLGTLVCLFVLNEVGMASLQSLSVTFGAILAFTSIIIIAGVFKLASGSVEERLKTPAGQADLERALEFVED